MQNAKFKETRGRIRKLHFAFILNFEFCILNFQLARLDAEVEATLGGVEFLLFERHRLQQ